jgi:hypothetical protein
MRKCLPYLPILAAMLSIIPCTIAQDKPDSDQDVSSRILKIACGKEEGKSSKCDILLSSYLDLEGLKKVVCEVTCKEKLADKAVMIQMSVRGSFNGYWQAVWIAGMLDIMHAEWGEANIQHNAVSFNRKKQCSCETDKVTTPKE